MPFAAAAIGAAATIGGAVISSNASSKAAKSAANTQRDAQQQEREIYEQGRSDQMPYMDAGKLGLDAVTNLSGANGLDAARTAQANFLESPGYQFQLEQGQKAIDRSAAARGVLRSGATIEASQKFGQGLAAQDFSTYYNRLSDISKLGQAAASGVAQQGSVLSNQIGQSAAGIAQTQASAGGQQASIYANAASNLGNVAGQAYSNYQYDQRKNALAGYGGGSDPFAYDSPAASAAVTRDTTTGF